MCIRDRPYTTRTRAVCTLTLYKKLHFIKNGDGVLCLWGTEISTVTDKHKQVNLVQTNNAIATTTYFYKNILYEHFFCNTAIFNL